MIRKLCLVVVAMSLASCGDKKDPVEPVLTATVSMPGYSFVPFSTVIRVGGSVIFDFPAESHNVIFTRKTGAPQDIQETVNARVTRVFNTAGSFPYDCTIHPGMSGEVLVQ